MEKNAKTVFFYLLSSVLFLSSCAHKPVSKIGVNSAKKTERRRVEKIEHTENYYADYYRNFVAYKPKGWKWSRKILKKHFWKPGLIKFMLLNEKTGGFITLRHGRKRDFGLPPYYSLDEPEMVYESKLIRGGDFEKRDPEYKTKSDCFPRPWMFYYRLKLDNVPYKLSVFANFRGEFLYFEMLSPEKYFQENMKVFKVFIDNITKADKLPAKHKVQAR